MVLPVTTTARVIAHLARKGSAEAVVGIDETAELEPLVNGVSSAVETYLRRHVLATARTEVYSPRAQAAQLSLRGYPVASLTDIREATDRQFASDSTVVDADTYYLDAEAGLVYFDFGLLGGAGSIQVAYTGGMAADTDALEAAFPSVVLAGTIAVAELWSRLDSLTVRDRSAGKTSVAYSPAEVLPEYARQLLDPFVAPRMV